LCETQKRGLGRFVGNSSITDYFRIARHPAGKSSDAEKDGSELGGELLEVVY
jgi:hypothetical protein